MPVIVFVVANMDRRMSSPEGGKGQGAAVQTPPPTASESVVFN